MSLRGKYSIHYISTKKQAADVLTKALHQQFFDITMKRNENVAGDGKHPKNQRFSMILPPHQGSITPSNNRQSVSVINTAHASAASTYNRFVCTTREKLVYA